MAFRSIVISLAAAIATILSAFIGFGVLTRDPGGLPDEPDRARPDGPDRDVRAADRVRDPVRALDGLHGLPDEPDPGGARARPEDAEAVEHGIAAIGRVIVAAARSSAPVRGVHPHVGPHLEGVRPPAGGRHPDRCAGSEDDARAVLPDVDGREVVVHPALARPAAAGHHDRAATRRRGAGGGAAGVPGRAEAGARA